MSEQTRQRIAEDYVVVWIDQNIDLKNTDCQNTLTALHSIVCEVKCFTTSQNCIQYLQQNKEAGFLISSGSLGQHLVPTIHDMDKVNIIYIFCGDQKKHETWAKSWPKIKGVYTDTKSLCEALQLFINHYNQNNMPISIIGTDEIDASQNLNQLEPSFMYSQIFKELLLDIQHDQESIQDLVRFCREIYRDNSKELEIIDEFASTYNSSKAIWWYTRECFTYKMLNKALRTLDGDIIIRMGFFLCDIHCQIQELHRKQINEYHGKPFMVYRGQGLSTYHFEKASNNKGGLISFNNFLSASTERQVSLNFARQASNTKDIVGILFEMTIDPNIPSSPFASIHQMSYFQNEAEVLFSMHTIFRISDIEKINDIPSVYRIHLKLTSDDDEKLRHLTEYIREQTGSGIGWARLGYLLAKIAQYDKAEELYMTLLKQTTKDDDKASIYNQLGYLKDEQGQYKEAIAFYEKCLEIKQKTLPENHLSLATCYNNIGGVYKNIGDYSKALEYYHKDRAILEKSLPKNHPDLATSCHNIGGIYKAMGEYSKALEYYQKDLEIMKKTLPENHPDLAIGYNDIGILYRHMNEYDKALEQYKKALKIREMSLPENHPDFAQSYSSIGLLLSNKGNNEEALENYKKALEIQKKTLHENHPLLATSYSSIGAVYGSMKKHSEALESYDKALKIRKISLPEDHPDFGMSYNNIAQIHIMKNEFSKALEYLEKALSIFQKSLPPTHPDIKVVQNNICEVKKKL